MQCTWANDPLQMSSDNGIISSFQHPMTILHQQPSQFKYKIYQLAWHHPIFCIESHSNYEPEIDLKSSKEDTQGDNHDSDEENI